MRTTVLKHTQWRYELITTKGKSRALIKTVEASNLNNISSGKSTYWPTNRNKIPYLVNFFVTKNIVCLDLSSNPFS